MNRYYDSGHKLSSKENNGIYIIREVIGRGSSSVVYLTDFTNKSGNVTEHILKEYNPKSIYLRRNESGWLSVVSDEDSAAFEEGLKRYKAGIIKQLELRRCDELKNYTANVHSTFYAYGTIYIDMTVTSGTAYQNVKERSLFDLMRRMKVLTHVIGIYHTKGYLHLDIKPENIYVRPQSETCEDVLLFVFDSITAKNDIANNALLSYTQQWAALELLLNRRNRICEATDLFAIGEIIFYKLAGRHSDNMERGMLIEFSFDYSSEIFENVNPKVRLLLTDLFRKTLSDSVNRRYQTAAELEAQIDKIISLCDPQKPYLRSTLPSWQGFFIGREKELAEIHNKFEENDVVFLCGVGGIGKTELAKYYAHKYKACYDTIIFAPIVNDIFSMIINNTILSIHNFFPEYDNLCLVDEELFEHEQQNIFKKLQKYYCRKIEKLKELCNEKTLIIVDNLDGEDEKWDDLKDLGCKLLITTRMNLSDAFPQSQIIVDKINEPFDVFKEYYKKPLSEEEKTIIFELMEIIGGHTLTVELLAKQMMDGRVKPYDMLERIKNGGIERSGREKVRRQGNISREQSAYEHISELFSLSKLTEEQRYVLSSLALIPCSGIPAEKFCKWCDLSSYDCINKLMRQGWIMRDEEKDYISVHNVPGEIILNNAVFPCDKIPLLDNLCSIILNNNISTIYCNDDNGQMAVCHDNDYDEYYEQMPGLVTGITKNMSKLTGYTKQKQVYLEKLPQLTFEKNAILAAINVIRETMVPDPNNDIILFELYYRLSCLYEERSDMKRMVECTSYALELAEKIWKDKKSVLVNHYYNCANRMIRFRNPKAKEYLRKALEYSASDHLTDKRKLSQIYKGLGDAIKNEDKEKSEEYYRCALKIAAGYTIDSFEKYRSESKLFKAVLNFVHIFESDEQFGLEADTNKGSEIVENNKLALKKAEKYMQEISKEWQLNSDLHHILQDFGKIFMSCGQLLSESGRNEEGDIYFHLSYEIRIINIPK